ncbi:Cytochrome P450 [Operophtera brumata]|uniref:unspecific monooxygenase n=1 Tax=Operophtera brumata TaxID=104452 RepID=A0A0L7LJH7_OPEBR|nr:Cytochrome P450 [Operophtera brumata]
MILALLFCFIASLLLAVYHVSKLKFNCWKNKKVPYLKPAPILGNYGENILLKKYVGKVVQDLCKLLPDAPCFGAFYGTEPVLIVQDPELIKLVMTKDYYYFSGREVSKYTDHEVFTKNIFFSGGDRWKVTRQNLTPLFSSAKIKNMFYLIENCAHIYETMLDKYMEESNVFEARGMMSRYTISGICSCAFGIDTQVMEKLDNNPFAKIAIGIFDNSTYRGFKNNVRAIWPAIFYGLGFKSFPVSIDKFFSELLTGIFEARGYKPSSRNDFVDLILNFKEKKYITGDSLSNMKTGDDKKVNIEVDNELLVAQCITFFAAGFETTATTLSFTLYELAKNQNAQKKVQEEIDSFLKKHNNKITYDSLKELSYLEACIHEAMRMYPVLGILAREVVDEYTFPSGLQLEKGMRVHVPVYALHHDPANFPEPEQFRPERFLPENKSNIKPYTYLPFGEGPRICIGARFAKMKMLPGLITILKKYRVELAPGMSSDLELGSRTLVTQPIGGIHLKAEVREGWEQRVFAKDQ